MIFVVQFLATFVAVRLEYEQHWYIVTDRSLRIRTGLFRVQESTMSFANLQQVQVSQGPLQRLLGLADVQVQSAGGGGAEEHKPGADASLHTGIFHSVANAPEIRDLILDRLGPTVLLVRDPRDTAVSQFFQWKHRMLARKKVINDYPLNDETSVNDFMTGQQAGLPKIIGFMNDWAAAAPKMQKFLVVRYEDLRADTKTQLRRVLEFFGEHLTDAELEDAVTYASMDNMRRMEVENAQKSGAHRSMKPGNADDPSSFKVRRGKVGGWRDYVSEEQADTLDRLVHETLNPVYGYSA